MDSPCRTIRQGVFFVIGGNPFENRRYTAKYSRTYLEYTGVYRANIGAYGAGTRGSVGVIMPISPTIAAAIHPYRYA